ncbi:oligosaccharide flippase family protein [Cytobacillus sp. BC1816]|uniref:oligosaccharide flippase family protein n=1 Tax=Cytobacillus sp. BC1816 TaxID=3440154 RepID=UPI003F510041
MIKNTILYTVGAMIPKFLVFMLLPLYTIYLAPDEYAIVTTVTAYNSLLIIFYGLGFQSSTVRIYYGFEKEQEQNRFLKEIFLFLLIYAAILTLIFFSLQDFLGPIMFKNIPYDPYYYLLVIFTFFNSFQIIPFIVMRVKEQPTYFLFYNVFYSIAYLVLNIFYLVVKDEGALGIVKAIVFSNLVAGILLVIYMQKQLKLFRKFTLKIGENLEHITFSVPFIFHMLAWSIFSVSDRIIIERYDSLYNLGIYSLGSQLVSILMIVITSLNQAISPKIYKEYYSKNHLPKKMMNKVVFGSIVFVGIISILLKLLIDPLIDLISSASYDADYTFVKYLLVSLIFHSVYMYLATPLFIYKKSKLISSITISSAVINIILNLIFIKTIGFYGVAIATMISKGLLVLLIFFASKKYDVGYKYPIIKIGLIVLLISLFLLL